MIGIIQGLKIAGIATIILSVLYAGNKVYEWHLDQIDTAVNVAMLEAAAQVQRAVTARENLIKEQAKLEKQEIETSLKIERSKVSDLQRMLLIDHDLDRLLQRKPGLILPRVNKGTEQILKELEELTQ